MGIRVKITLPTYQIARKNRLSRQPMTNKQVLAYLNASKGLKEEIVSFSVEDTQIVYPPVARKEKKNVHMGTNRQR